MGTWVSYLDEQQPLEGYLAAPDSARDLPGVLVVPSWLNVNESICRRADRLVGLGLARLMERLRERASNHSRLRFFLCRREQSLRGRFP